MDEDGEEEEEDDLNLLEAAGEAFSRACESSSCVRPTFSSFIASY